MKNSLKYQASEGRTEGKTYMEDLHGRKHNQVTEVLQYLMHRFPVTKTQSVG